MLLYERIDTIENEESNNITNKDRTVQQMTDFDGAVNPKIIDRIPRKKLLTYGPSDIIDKVIDCSRSKTQQDITDHVRKQLHFNLRKRGIFKCWKGKGFGFIQQNDNGRDIFVHVSNIDGKMVEGDTIKYEIGPGRNGDNKQSKLLFATRGETNGA